MNWFAGLTRTNAAKADGPKPSPGKADAAAGPRLADLRRRVAQAASAAERAQWECELGRALGECAADPAQDDPEAVIAAAVSHARDKTAGLQWMERLRLESSFAEVAMQAPFAELRFAAAQRLEDGVLLEQVAAATRERDKRVHRHCAEILRRRRDSAALTVRAEGLLAALVALGEEPAPLPVARLAQAERDVAELGEAPEAAPCRARLEQLHLRLREEAEALRNAERLALRAQELARSATQDLWPLAEHLAGWRAAAQELAAASASLPAWLKAGAGVRDLREAMSRLEARFAVCEEDIARHAACELHLDALNGKAGDAAAWDLLPKPASAAAQSLLQARWNALTLPEPAPVEAPAAQRKPAPKLDLAAIQAALGQLEQALEHGQVADAERADARMEKLSAAGELPRSVDARWKRARAEVLRLQDWARWGNSQAHDQLIAEAEQLLAVPAGIEATADAVNRMRERWKQLDAAGPGSRAQWARFDALLEKAWKPVAEHRAEQAAKQQLLRAAREALLVQWEEWLKAIDWARPDWRGIERRRAEMLAQWHAGARAGFRDERVLRKRFDPLIEQIEAHLAEARKLETARREDLVAAAQALLAEADLHRAIDQARLLQARWKEDAGSIYLGRRKDEDLWKRFRAACDAVFARREAQRAERVAQAQQMLAARKDILDGLEGALAAAVPGEVEAALARFRSAWRDAAPAPREAAGELEARATRLARMASERIAELKRARRAARYTILAHKAELAGRVEQAALRGEGVEEALAQARAEWQAAGELDAEAERALQSRLQAAARATAAVLEGGGLRRADLLLDLELALELPTPADHAQARRRRQLNLLAERFANGAQRAAPEQSVVRWYATPAAADAGCDARMAAIVGALLAREGSAAGAVPAGSGRRS